jgi:hypothetical protein
VLHAQVSNQPQPSTPDKLAPAVQQNNQGAPNFNIPGSGNQVYLGVPPSPIPQHRRSRDVYQENERYGQAEGIEPDPTAGIVMIRKLKLEPDFSPGKDFELGHYRLHIVSQGASQTNVTVQGTLHHLSDVTCKIVGHVQQ